MNNSPASQILHSFGYLMTHVHKLGRYYHLQRNNYQNLQKNVVIANYSGPINTASTVITMCHDYSDSNCPEVRPGGGRGGRGS